MAKIIQLLLGLIMLAAGTAMLMLSFDKAGVPEILDRRNLLFMGISWIIISLGYAYVILFVI